jgi:hypothetical protein
MRRGLRICAAVAFFLLTAKALATTVERLAVSDLVVRAERIVEGKVLEVSAARDLRGRPATRVRVAVSTRLKGDPADTLEWLLPGGADDKSALVIPGIPKFNKDDHVVLFMSKPSTAGLSLPIGLGQGAYRGALDPKTKKTKYTPDLAGLEFAGEKGNKNSAAVAVERDALLAEIRRHVEGK